ANLKGAVFTGADLTRASLDGANISGADFSTAKGLKQGQLESACGDGATKLPNGLSVRLCKMHHDLKRTRTVTRTGDGRVITVVTMPDGSTHMVVAGHGPPVTIKTPPVPPRPPRPPRP
ncbi:MAG: pentapeptide repeat-containing protein, partial [Pseudomonadota bacterium]|nr:pentapeptide repeat-containing protein [Pseudomonadota bacterium]